MDIAVLADIHSNHYALRACLEVIEQRKIEQIIFLGDYAGELPYAQKTMNILYDLNTTKKCYFIKGNREKYMLDYKQNGEQGWLDCSSASGALLNTYEELTEKDISFFDNLPETFIFQEEGMPDLFCCHGSPNRINEYVSLKSDRALELLNESKFSYILYGHTHIQGIKSFNGKFLINPGAVGAPIESQDAKAQFAILHSMNQKWETEFISIPYPLEQCIKELRNSPLIHRAPTWSKLIEYCLRFGVAEMSTNVLNKAMDICRQREGHCEWPDIPEKDWEQAAKEFHIEEMLNDIENK